MSKIGFFYEEDKQEETKTGMEGKPCTATAPRRSLVQVSFPGHGSLTYFNDTFDLHEGDRVFVEGKLEGIRGRVEQVSYGFKIKTADYKRVISVADTDVHGDFSFAGSHFVTFDPCALPVQQAKGWFLPAIEETFEQGWDDDTFPLGDLRQIGIAPQIAERGFQYYRENKVSYLCLDGSKGYAIVEGTHPYEVEFEYQDGEIGRLSCTCPCVSRCKHELAAMLQLQELMECIMDCYEESYRASGYFAAILKPTLFSLAVDSKPVGRMSL